MSILDYLLQPEVAIPGVIGGLLTAEEYNRLLPMLAKKP